MHGQPVPLPFSGNSEFFNANFTPKVIKDNKFRTALPSFQNSGSATAMRRLMTMVWAMHIQISPRSPTVSVMTMVYMLKYAKPIFHCDTKPFALGPGVGLDPQRHNVALGSCWYLKMLKFALPPTRNIKFALPPTQKPNMSQWNIGCVWSPMKNYCIGEAKKKK